MAEAHAKDHKDEKAQKGPSLKSVKTTDDDEAPASAMASSAAKQRILATALSRAIVISTIIGSLVIVTGNLFAARYELVRGPNTDNNFVYRLDRLTGAVRFCGQQQCSDVSVVAK